MDVIANAKGYFGGKLREAGESFSIASKDELGSWMDVAGGVNDGAMPPSDADILNALRTLDVTGDIWTKGGDVTMIALETALQSAGFDVTNVVRADVVRVVPEFTKETPELPMLDDAESIGK